MRFREVSPTTAWGCWVDEAGSSEQAGGGGWGSQKTGVPAGLEQHVEKRGKTEEQFKGTTSRLRCLAGYEEGGIGKGGVQGAPSPPSQITQQVGGEGRLFIHLTRL